VSPGKRPRAIPEPTQDDTAGSAPSEYLLEPGNASKSAGLDRHWGVGVPTAEGTPPMSSSRAPPQRRRVTSAVDSEASNEAFECVMVGSAEDLGDSEDASPAYRDFLPDVWVPACIMAVLIYFGTLALVQAQWIPSDNADTFRETPPLHDAKYSSAADPYFSWVAELCAVAFLASAARNLGTIAFMRRGSSQTSVLLCVTLINLVAAHAHWLMAYGVGPVYDSCFGRRMHVRAKYRCIMNNAHSLFFSFLFSYTSFVSSLPNFKRIQIFISSTNSHTLQAVRFAEWLSMVFLLAVVMNALDCPSWFELVRSTSLHVIAVALGFASTFTCQLWGPLPNGECPWLVGSGIGGVSDSSISSISFSSSSGGMSAAIVNEGHWKHRGVSGPEDNAWWSPAAFVRSSGAHKGQLVLLLLGAVCYMDLFRVLKRRAAKQPLSTAAAAPAQALLLTLWASITWSLCFVVYFVAIFHPTWFTSTHEDVANCIVDLMAKFLYTNVLSEAHLWHFSPEEVRAELKLIESANDAQRHFLRYVFHEVRVPLNTIRLGIDSIQQGSPLELETSFVVSCMDEAVNTMSETLNDVLSYQKIEEGKVELVPGPFAIDEFMRAVTLGFEATVQAKSLTLEQESDPRVPLELVGDALRLRQVLNNFISNAIKFTGEGGVITLRSRLLALSPPSSSAANESLPASPSTVGAADSGSASTSGTPVLGENDNVDRAAVEAGTMATMEFSVTDSGIGIAPEDQRKLFQAFSQIRAGDLQSGRGSGLGLSICKHMIHLMGGSIGLRSRPGQGSTFFFTVTLPVAAPGSATLRTNSLSSGSEGAGSAQPNLFLRGKVIDSVSSTGSNSGLQRSMTQSSPASEKKSGNGAKVALASSSKIVPDLSSATVLIVDDVTMNRKMIKRCVQQLGFVCDEACDGAEAVTMCDAKHYSLVLMDNVMPHMNGMEAAAAIRRNDAVDGWSGTRIFGLTGNALSEDVAEFQRAGCDEVLTKPLRFDHFKQLLSAYGLFEESK